MRFSRSLTFVVASLALGLAWPDESSSPASSSAIEISPRNRASDDAAFAVICGCISRRIAIQRDASTDFVPVGWSLRTMDGRYVTPREEREGAKVTLDMAAHKPGIYLVTLRNASGHAITRPLRVE